MRPIQEVLTFSSGGPILTSALGAGGLLYAIGDTGTIADGTGGTYRVLTVDLITGAVLAYLITAAGTGYTVATHGTTPAGAQAGLGDGNFTIAVSTVASSGEQTLAWAGRATRIYAEPDVSNSNPCYAGTRNFVLANSALIGVIKKIAKPPAAATTPLDNFDVELTHGGNELNTDDYRFNGTAGEKIRVTVYPR